MKIAISGGAGFLGSHLVEAMLEDGHDVISFDNFIGGYRDNVITHPKHTFHEADMLDLNEMNEILQGCDAIYHTAALAHEGLSVFAPTVITNNIMTGTVTLATAVINNGVRRFINMSSMARYGENAVPFHESMLPKPSDPYGMAKVCAENQLNLLAEIHGFEVVHALPHNIIGPRQKFDDPFRNVVSIMVNLILQGRPPIIYGDGEQKRCFSFVQDDIFVLRRLLDCDLKCNGELFNIGPDEEFVSINELATLVLELMESDLSPIYYPERPREVKFATCSADKTRERFGYETKVTLREGIKSIIDYIKSRGPRKFDYYIDLEIQNEKTPETWLKRKF